MRTSSARSVGRGPTAITLVIGLSLLVAACTGSTATQGAASGAATQAPDTATEAPSGSLDGMRVVFITAGNASEYQIAQGEWFKQFAEAEGASASVIDGKFDPQAQLKGIEDSIAAGVDGIVIQQIDPVALVSAVNAAKAAGVLFMAVGGLAHPDAMVPVGGTFNDESLVREAARDAVAWLQAKKPGEAAKLVLFDIPAIIVCHEWRMVAFRDEVIKTIGGENTEDVYNDLVDHSLDVVTAKMEDIIQSGADFNMFSACGGTGAVGGLDAMVAAGKAKAIDGVPEDIWVLSIDATPAELEYLVDPDVALTTTIALTPKTNAQVFLDNFKKMVAGEIQPDENYVADAPGILFRKADGCQTISETLADQYSIVPGYSVLECS